VENADTDERTRGISAHSADGWRRISIGGHSEVSISGSARRGRFLKIGLPLPELLGPFVGMSEITCGSLVALGLFTRLAAIPLLVIMAVALAMTKWPLLATQGFWYMAHESRTDWSMSLGAFYLLIVGSGSWSLDAWLARRH
jgi:putative oxidoreductase